MKYDDIVPPGEAYKEMVGTYGWEKSGQMAFEHMTKQFFRPLPTPESKIVKQFRFLIPGRIYTYQYDPLYKDLLAYYDKRPVFLCVKSYVHPKTNNNLAMGLNLNFMPPENRISIMELLWKSFKPTIKRDLAGRKPETDAVGRQEMLFTENFDVYGLLNYILDTVGNTHWKFGIRQYIFDRMENIKWIDYPDWHWVSLLHAKDLMGITERELITLYWKEHRARKKKSAVQVADEKAKKLKAKQRKAHGKPVI